MCVGGGGAALVEVSSVLVRVWAFLDLVLLDLLTCMCWFKLLYTMQLANKPVFVSAIQTHTPFKSHVPRTALYSNGTPHD